MKNVFTLITLILTTCSLMGQLTNPGFEEWEEKTVLLTTFEDPVSWNTPNEFTALGSVVVTKKSEDAPEGSFCAEMETKQIPPTSFKAPGLVTYADFTVDFETQDFNFSGGLFLKAKVYSLSGKYKFTGAQGDSATALIYSFKHPEGSDLDTIGLGFQYLKDASEWTDFTINMLALNDNTPDTFNILLMSSGTFDPAAIPEGSKLYVDDLSIETNVGIFDLADRKVQVSTFPNPATDMITFKTAEPNDERQLIIVDKMGRKVREIDFHNSTMTISISNLPTGNYSFITSESGRLVGSGSFLVK
jgi:hypothetical protein